MNEKTYMVWSDELEMFAHVSEQEAKRIELLKPEIEFRPLSQNSATGILFIQKKGVVA